MRIGTGGMRSKTLEPAYETLFANVIRECWIIGGCVDEQKRELLLPLAERYELSPNTALQHFDQRERNILIALFDSVIEDYLGVDLCDDVVIISSERDTLVRMNQQTASKRE